MTQENIEDKLKELAKIIEDTSAETNPDAIKHFNKGVEFHKKEEYEVAIFEYREAIEIVPNYMEAHNNLGLVFMIKGYIEAGIEEFRKAIEIDPDRINPRANLHLALQYQYMVNQFNKKPPHIHQPYSGPFLNGQPKEWKPIEETDLWKEVFKSKTNKK
jgi:tetratricopeptide (TPR) repeat protein